LVRRLRFEASFARGIVASSVPEKVSSSAQQILRSAYSPRKAGCSLTRPVIAHKFVVHIYGRFMFMNEIGMIYPIAMLVVRDNERSAILRQCC
jgi:hypothetical protein